MKGQPSKIPKIRKSWIINPRTRIKESHKRYKRAEIKKQLKQILKRPGHEEST